MICLFFELKPSKRIEKQIEKLDKPMRLKLLDLFLKLKENPVPVEEFHVTKLSGTTSTYRIRIQRTRIIYDVCWKEKKIEILKIDKRKESTYKNL